MKMNYIPSYFSHKFNIYNKLFNEYITSKSKPFFINIFYVGISTLLSVIFIFGFNIISAKVLGPSEYGKFIIIQSTSMFLYIPMLISFHNAMVKYNAETDDFDTHKKIISTSFILVIVFTLVSLIVYYIFSSQISNALSITQDFFYYSAILAVSFVFYTLSINCLRSLLSLKVYAILQSFNSICLLILFLTLIFYKTESFIAMWLAMIISYILSSIIILIIIRKYISIKFSIIHSNILIKYSVFALFGVLSFVVYTNADNILIGKFMAISDVGIYKVYKFTSIDMIGVVIGVVNTILFPIASRYKDKGIIFNKIDKYIPLFFIIGVPFIIILQYAILNIYGASYPINFELILLFSIAGILNACYSIYDWIFCSAGIEGLKLVNISTVLIAIVDLSLNVILIPKIGLTGAIISNIFAFTIGLLLLLRSKRRLSSV